MTTDDVVTSQQFAGTDDFLDTIRRLREERDQLKQKLDLVTGQRDALRGTVHDLLDQASMLGQGFDATTLLSVLRAHEVVRYFSVNGDFVLYTTPMPDPRESNQ